MLQHKSRSASGEQGFAFTLDTKSVTADGEFEGYAAYFGNRDSGGDIVERGAFAQTLKSRPAQSVKMLLQHDMAQPVGIWTDLKEDDRGLWAKGRLLLTTTIGRETHEFLKAGALDGLSIGFRTVKSSVDKRTGARRLTQIELFEISIVTFPLNEQTRVASVKTEFDPREMEDALRDAGLSQRDRKAAVAVFRKLLQRDAEEPGRGLCEAAAGALMSIRRATEALRS